MKPDDSGSFRLVAGLLVPVMSWFGIAHQVHAAGPVPVPVQVSGFEEPEAEFAGAWRSGSPQVPARVQQGAGPDGSRAVVLAAGGGDDASRLGSLVQSLDATPWRNQRLRLSAQARFRDARPNAFLWMRFDDASGNTLSTTR